MNNLIFIHYNTIYRQTFITVKHLPIIASIFFYFKLIIYNICGQVNNETIISFFFEFIMQSILTHKRGHTQTHVKRDV